MSNQMTAERQQVLKDRNERTPRSKGSSRSISKELYEKAPQSRFFPLQIALSANHLFLTLASKLRVGQFMLSIFDYFLNKMEKTLNFCVPDDEFTVSTSRKSSASTGPPMNWLLLIPVLIGLRCVCIYLSVIGIVLGRGEVNAKILQTKLVAFRRYFESVRHYAVRKYSAEEFEDKKYRCTLLIWRFVYGIYESIIATTSPLDKYIIIPESAATEEQTDTRPRQRKGGSVMKKSSLNQIDDDRDDESTDDDVKENDLSTNQMLDEYSLLKDSSMDPDYEPSEEPSSEEISSEGEVSSEEERTESQKMLNGKPELNSINGLLESPVKSKTTTLDEQQMMELEDQLVMKIMSHFKENFNYAPHAQPTEDVSPDVFYSPIGSPPELAYNSESGNNTKSLTDDALILQRLKAEAAAQIQEISSSKKTKDVQADKVAADPKK